MNHCRDCQHFRLRDEYRPDAPHLIGECRRAESYDGEQLDKASLAMSSDAESYVGRLFVHENFGCIQFEPTTGTESNASP